MYCGYELTEKSRNELLRKFPPLYADVICEHITLKFPCYDADPMPAMPSSVKIVGEINATGVQGLLVEVDGTTERPHGGKFHITLSIDRSIGITPKDTNKYVGDDYVTKTSPVSIEVVPKKFN